MDFVYIFSLALLVILALMFYKNNNEKLSLLMIAIAVYVVYSHETGNTATNFKNDVVTSIRTSSESVGNKYGVKSFNAEEVKKEVEKEQ